MINAWCKNRFFAKIYIWGFYVESIEIVHTENIFVQIRSYSVILALLFQLKKYDLLVFIYVILSF